MNVLRASDFVASVVETGLPRDTSGAIGYLILALMSEREEIYIADLMADRNRLRTDGSWEQPALESARESLYQVLKAISERACLPVQCG
jgi:hypothetical protein